MKCILCVSLSLVLAISFSHGFAQENLKPDARLGKDCTWEGFVEFCKTRECRKDSVVKIKKKDGSYFARVMDLAPPAVEPHSISILPGETLLVEADIDGDRLVNLKQVKTVCHPEKTIRLKFWQEPSIRDGTEMVLKVLNPFDKYLKYRLYMMSVDSDSTQYTSSCPVIPGKLSYEHWPYPLFQIFVLDLKLIKIEGDKIVCQ